MYPVLINVVYVVLFLINVKLVPILIQETRIIIVSVTIIFIVLCQGACDEACSYKFDGCINANTPIDSSDFSREISNVC